MTEPAVNTLTDLFDRSVDRIPRDRALTYWTPRQTRHVSTEALRRQVARFAAGLISLGVRKGDRVLLLSENRPEWAAADYATMFAGGILVPVYTSLTAPQLSYILANSGARVAIASSQDLLDKLLASAAGLSSLRQAVVIDQDAAAIDVMHFESVAALGDDLLATSKDAWREPAGRIREDDVATIIYTSGTTGPPKGVMLSHRNILSNIKALCDVLDFRGDDTSLSFLPLCHITQRVADYCYFNRGVRIVYVRIEDLAVALGEVRPTTFPGVPRVYEKARDAILARIAGQPAPLRALAGWALRVGQEMALARQRDRAPGPWLAARFAVADRLALSRIRKGMGGRLRYVVSGGAPLNPEVMRFFLAVGLPILEGYGLTETTVLAINRPEGPRAGTVGPPVPGAELRIEEDGEILARGAGISRGYYLDVKRTEEAFSDGWFRTGDLGRLDERGSLIISGRKKELLVTSGGKKISPAPIEQELLADGLISQAVLVGDGRKFIAALLVPDRGRLLAHCRQSGLLNRNHGSIEDLVERPEVMSLFKRIVERINSGLSRFEQVKKFALLPTELTVEGGDLTPTLKVKRHAVEEKYRDVIESLYREG